MTTQHIEPSHCVGLEKPGRAGGTAGAGGGEGGEATALTLSERLQMQSLLSSHVPRLPLFTFAHRYSPLAYGGMIDWPLEAVM